MPNTVQWSSSIVRVYKEHCKTDSRTQYCIRMSLINLCLFVAWSKPQYFTKYEYPRTESLASRPYCTRTEEEWQSPCACCCSLLPLPPSHTPHASTPAAWLTSYPVRPPSTTQRRSTDRPTKSLPGRPTATLCYDSHSPSVTTSNLLYEGTSTVLLVCSPSLHGGCVPVLNSTLCAYRNSLLLYSTPCRPLFHFVLLVHFSAQTHPSSSHQQPSSSDDSFIFHSPVRHFSHLWPSRHLDRLSFRHFRVRALQPDYRQRHLISSSPSTLAWLDNTLVHSSFHSRFFADRQISPQTANQTGHQQIQPLLRSKSRFNHPIHLVGQSTASHASGGIDRDTSGSRKNPCVWVQQSDFLSRLDPPCQRRIRSDFGSALSLSPSSPLRY